MKVLVVHRNEAVLESIKAQLSQWYIRSCMSGLDGLLCCRGEHFDLILCGLDLPVVTGIEMVRSIRNFSVNKKTPVILLAEGNETADHVRLLNLMNANLLTLEEVTEMQNLNLE
jgi:DNA-binding response OmpR family regulator